MQDVIENAIINVIKGCLEENESVEEIGVHDNLTNYGVDSIAFIKIVVKIETEFGIEFEDDALDSSRFSTAESIVDYVKSLM